MDLRALSRYAAVSDRTLREWIRRTGDPLPASQVGNKFLVNRHRFDEWLERHPFRPVKAAELDRLVDDIVSDLKLETA